MSVKNLKRILLKDPSFKKFFNKHELSYEIAVMIMTERIKAGYTQAQLAKKAKVLTPSIGRIEMGNHLPNLNTLRKIAKGLGKKIVIKFI